MEPASDRPWYKKKRYLIPVGVVAALALGSAGFSSPSPSPQASFPAPAAAVQGVSSLSNDTYYTNVDGNRVHSPAYSDSAPAGASAKCRDGTYSFSQHRSGTCSHHGGVSRWL